MVSIFCCCFLGFIITEAEEGGNPVEVTGFRNLTNLSEFVEEKVGMVLKDCY